eukprot:5112079-Lingulodinium_polyedra.AAC.1
MAARRAGAGQGRSPHVGRDLISSLERRGTSDGAHVQLCQPAAEGAGIALRALGAKGAPGASD